MTQKTVRTAVVVFICAAIPAVTGCRGKSLKMESDAREVKQSITFSGYPMDALDQNISWFGVEGYQPNQVYAGAEQSPFHQWLAEMLGVRISWQWPIRGTPSGQSLNLLLSGTNLPDIIFGPVMSDAQRYIEEGAFRDLTPYLQEWSPAYWAWIHSDPAYDRAMKTDSGKYYGYGFFREAGGWNDTYLGPVVNKAWLDECGLPLPVTISDWDRTLRAFKERYGATLSFSWSEAAGYSTFLSGAFGAHTFADYRLYIDKNRKVQFANITPEYRKQLEKFAEWWRDGLLDQDFLSTNNTMARTNALNRKMGLSITTMGQLSNWIADAKAQNTGADWMGLQYPTGDDGTLVQVTGGYGIGTVAAVVSASCPDEKLELVMRALDYAYTDEGKLFWNFGKRGVSWDYDADGKPAYLPLVTNDPDGMNNAIDKYGGATWSGNCIQATALLYMKNTPASIAANDLWYYPNRELTWSDKLPPGITFTAEESTRAAELKAAIRTYADETAIRFITGQDNFSSWDGYVARINSMGLGGLLELYQAAYDRYLAR